MDFNKKIESSRSKINRGISKYGKSSTLEGHESAIYTTTQGLNELKMVAKYCPPYMKSNLYPLIEKYEKKLAIMIEHKGKVAQAAPVGGGGHGGGKGGDDNEDDKLSKGIMEAIITEKPNVKWTDIGGLEGAKTALRDAVIMPIKYPNFFNDVVKPWKGILLYGPPGTGKTYLAKACATECDSTFFSVSSSDLVSKYVGESARLIKALFTAARKEKAAIIFIDEIDSLCSSRSENENESSRRVKTEFLVQMDGVGSEGGRVLVLGATNIPWDIDMAIRRRFEKRIYIPLPDFDACRFLVEHMIKGVPVKITPKEFDEIGHAVDGYSGSDINVLCKDAAMNGLKLAQDTTKFKKIFVNGKQKYMPLPLNTPPGPDVHVSKVFDLPFDSLVLPVVTKQDYLTAMTRSKASVGQDDLKEFEDWTAKFGEEGS